VKLKDITQVMAADIHQIQVMSHVLINFKIVTATALELSTQLLTTVHKLVLMQTTSVKTKETIETLVENMVFLVLNLTRLFKYNELKAGEIPLFFA